jgi:membrane fusion protein (multidrug efflux system)
LDKDGKTRAHTRQVESGTMLGDEVVIHAGLSAGERVAVSGSFKLRDSVLVAISGDPQDGSRQDQVIGKR